MLKYATYLNDVFQFQNSVSICEDAVLYLEETWNLKKQITEKESPAHVSLGKAYSQLGQGYALLQDEKAEETFETALQYLQHDTANYNITLSYLLHYYMDRKDKRDLVLQKSVQYFGGNTKISDQFDYMIAEYKKGRKSVIDLRYSLYVLLKEIYFYRFDELSNDKNLKEALLNLKTTLHQKLGENEPRMSGHPWELIYKYLLLLAAKSGRINLEKKYIKLLMESIPYESPVLDAIKHVGLAEYYECKADNRQREKSIMKACEAAKKVSPKNDLTIESYDDLRKYILFFYW